MVTTSNPTGLEKTIRVNPCHDDALFVILCTLAILLVWKRLSVLTLVMTMHYLLFCAHSKNASHMGTGCWIIDIDL